MFAPELPYEACQEDDCRNRLCVPCTLGIRSCCTKRVTCHHHAAENHPCLTTLGGVK